MEETIELVLYEHQNGKIPFNEWFNAVTDEKIRGRIYARLYRVRVGSFGDCKCLGHSLWELRFTFGSGYRIYFGKKDSKIVVLLCAGNKSSQKKDIKKSKEYWEIFKKNYK